MHQQESQALGILIPTKNRPDFLIRQLIYYANVNCRYTIYVGDSSDPGCFERTKEAVRNLQANLNIVHLPLPGLWITEAWHELLQHVVEPYAAYCGDDDFLVPATLAKCARFLDENPDYSIAHGGALLITTESGSAFGKMAHAGRYLLGTTEDTSASQRLRSFLDNYYMAGMSLQRTQEFRRDIEASLLMTHEVLKGILTFECLRIVRGKTKELDGLYVVRHGHAENYKMPDVFDWISSPEWAPSYQTFSGLLVEELALQDHLTVSKAQEVVKETFWRYLSHRMSYIWVENYASEVIGIRARGRKSLARIPMLKKAWPTVRSFFPGDSNKTSLPSLLRPSSPYHAEFMPIYHAVTAPPSWAQPVVH